LNRVTNPLFFEFSDEDAFAIAGERETYPDEEPPYHITAKILFALEAVIAACVVSPV
jgi:hypothetical protein